MEDTLTITFFLAGGKTVNGDRSLILPASTLWFVPQSIRFDPNLEDMGVGFLLDDPTVVAIDVAWVDDYEDSLEPVLAATAIYYAEESQHEAQEARNPDDLRPRGIDAPYYEMGVQITEWIVGYMQEHVYNQDMDDDNMA